MAYCGGCVRPLQYGIDYDMNFVSGLPPGSRELLEGTQPMPSTMAEIAGTFSDYPEIANQVYQIDSLLKEIKTTPHVSFTPTEAYLRDISVLVGRPLQGVCV